MSDNLHCGIFLLLYRTAGRSFLFPLDDKPFYESFYESVRRQFFYEINVSNLEVTVNPVKDRNPSVYMTKRTLFFIPFGSREFNHEMRISSLRVSALSVEGNDDRDRDGILWDISWMGPSKPLMMWLTNN